MQLVNYPATGCKICCAYISMLNVPFQQQQNTKQSFASVLNTLTSLCTDLHLFHSIFTIISLISKILLHLYLFGMPFCPYFEALKLVMLCASPSHVVCWLDKTRSLTPPDIS